MTRAPDTERHPADGRRHVSEIVTRRGTVAATGDAALAAAMVRAVIEDRDGRVDMIAAAVTAHRTGR